MRKTITNISLAVPTLVLALTALVTVPAFAQHGSADDTSGSNDTTTSTSGDASGGTNETETETEHLNSTELHHRGSLMVGQLEKEHHSQKTAEERTKACESHKHGLETKFARITTNSQRLEDHIGTFLTRAETYQSTNNITVDNWTTLVANADAAKLKVDASIANLKTVTPTLDCNSTTVAQDVATFKAAAQQVRTDLKAYKTAVKDVFVALENAKEAANTTTDTNTEGSN